MAQLVRMFFFWNFVQNVKNENFKQAPMSFSSGHEAHSQKTSANFFQVLERSLFASSILIRYGLP
jgi:hypothetical protein